MVTFGRAESGGRVPLPRPRHPLLGAALLACLGGCVPGVPFPPVYLQSTGSGVSVGLLPCTSDPPPVSRVLLVRPDDEAAEAPLAVALPEDGELPVRLEPRGAGLASQDDEIRVRVEFRDGSTFDVLAEMRGFSSETPYKVHDRFVSSDEFHPAGSWCEGTTEL